MSCSSPRYAHQGISFQFSNPAFQPPQILAPSLQRFLSIKSPDHTIRILHTGGPISSPWHSTQLGRRQGLGLYRTFQTQC